MAVSKRLRYEVLRRDNHACRYCGACAPDVALTVDHVIPVALGGNDKPDNLVAACRDCNAGKSASSPDAPIVADVAADALRWGAAMQYATEIQLRDAKRRDDVRRWFEECWNDWGCGPEHLPVPRPPDWEATLMRFEAYGVNLLVIYEALRYAMNNRRVAAEDTWRYFCGICWRRVSELREAAASQIAYEDGEATNAT